MFGQACVRPVRTHLPDGGGPLEYRSGYMIRRLIGELKAPRLSSFTDVLGEALGRLALPPKIPKNSDKPRIGCCENSGPKKFPVLRALRMKFSVGECCLTTWRVSSSYQELFEVRAPKSEKLHRIKERNSK